MSSEFDNILRLDYAVVALTGAFLAIALDRLIKRIGRTRLWRRSRSGWRRNILTLVLLLLIFSAWQYYRQGRVVWPADLYYTLQEAVNSPTSARRATARQVETTDSITGRVSRIIDGDSIELRNTEAVTFAIRLYGVDTPEWDQPYGSRARRALAMKIGNRTVSVEAEDVDSYGRLVGTVFYNGDNVNLQMIQEGHAWWYREYARGERHLANAEELARAAEIGLWRQTSPTPPWEWRRR